MNSDFGEFSVKMFATYSVHLKSDKLSIKECKNVPWQKFFFFFFEDKVEE